MRLLIPCGLAIALLVSAQAPQKFTGKITDSMCARADHSSMQMGSNDAECTKACVLAHGAEYVLFDGEHVYTLDDQKLPEKFAGHRVMIDGILDAKSSTITKMTSIKVVK